MSESRSSRLGAILGTSRCGSTWLGAIVNSHPDVAYRFEPFHRLGRTTLRSMTETLKADRFQATDVDALHRLLLPAHPGTDKPPFFEKSFRSRVNRGRSLLWPPARKGMGAGLYRFLYSPIGSPFLVFKDVNYERAIPGLLRAGVPVVYLMRHPCAVVWSHLKGQERGAMGGAREDFLDRKLARQNGALAARFLPRLDGLSKAQKRALLWRLSVDDAFERRDDEGLHVVFYESLCHDPVGESEKAFAHLGLQLPEQTRAFLKGEPGGRLTAFKHGQIAGDKYFSVFRAPLGSVAKWREQMPEEEQARVLEVVSDSPAYVEGKERASWDQLS